MGKLHGISMGCDACYTNHADADQNDLENLEMLLTTAGCNFFMGLPMGDDVMLNYQSTSFHDDATLRQLFGLPPRARVRGLAGRDGHHARRQAHRARRRSERVRMKPTPPHRRPRRRGAGARGAGARDRRRARATAREIDIAGALLLTPDRGVNVGEPYDPRVMPRILAATPARVAVGRTGPRYRTNTMLRFRADHAAAKDAVMSEVDPELLARARDVRDRLARARQGDLPAAPRSRPRAVRRGARRADASGSAARPTLVVIYGDGLSAAAHQPAPRGVPRRAGARRWRRAGIGHAPRVLRAPLAREDHGRDRAPGRRAGGAVRLRRAPGPRASPTRCPPTTSINRPPARPTPTAR